MAILASYTLNDHWKLAGRAEYIDTTGNAAAPNLLYGPGSNAFSFTITPTWQYKVLFLRPELSYVVADSTSPLLALGQSGQTKDQFRSLLEGGILF
jgi:Putative beta-barrel porin-2, OmpL-like. bbp2